MNREQARRLRGAVAGLPFTGGGIHTPEVLWHFDRAWPLGDRDAVPPIESFIRLIDAIGEAQKADIPQVQAIERRREHHR